MRILLIEPGGSLAKVYGDYLNQQGHEAIMCGTAKQAIAICDDRHIDIIVLELLLGEHNGVEFLYEFRSYADWQNVPVLLLSMLPLQELRQYRRSLEQLNVVQCLYKPTTTLKQLEYAVTSISSANLASV